MHHHPVTDRFYEQLENDVREGRHLEPTTTSDSVVYWVRYLIVAAPTLGVITPLAAGAAYFNRQYFHIVEVVILQLLCFVAVFGWVQILGWFAMTHALPAHPLVLSAIALPVIWFAGYIGASSHNDLINHWHQKYHGSRI